MKPIKKIIFVFIMVMSMSFLFIVKEINADVLSLSSFKMQEGASIRYKKDQSDLTNGIRFIAEMDKEEFDNLSKENLEIGMLLIPTKLLSSDSQFNLDTANAKKAITWDSKINYWSLNSNTNKMESKVAIYNIPEEQYKTSISAVSYVMYNNDKATAIYSSNIMSRSIYNVACSLLNNESQTSHYTELGAYVDNITINGVKYDEVNVTKTIIDDNLTIAYDDGKFLLSATDGQTVTLKSIVGDNVVFEKGAFSINGVVVADNLIFQKESNVNFTTGGRDSIQCSNSIKIYGTLSLNDPSNSKTAIVNTKNLTIELSRDSNITITGYAYAFGTFVSKEDGIIYLPDDYQYESGVYYYQDGEAKITLIKVVNCTTTCRFAFKKLSQKALDEEAKLNYKVLPTLISTGLMVDDTELPILNTTDYSYVEKDGYGIFTHKKYSKVVVNVEIKSGTDKIKINGVEYNNVLADATYPNLVVDYVDDTFVLSTLGNKEITLTQLSGSKITIESGTISITGSSTLVAKRLIINEGATLNILSTNNGIQINGDAETYGECRIDGTLNITADKSEGTLDKTAFEAKVDGVKVYLGKTACITFSKYANGFGSWVGGWEDKSGLKIYCPTGSITDSTNKVITISIDDVIITLVDATNNGNLKVMYSKIYTE